MSGESCLLPVRNGRRGGGDRGPRNDACALGGAGVSPGARASACPRPAGEVRAWVAATPSDIPWSREGTRDAHMTRPPPQTGWRNETTGSICVTSQQYIARPGSPSPACVAIGEDDFGCRNLIRCCSGEQSDSAFVSYVLIMILSKGVLFGDIATTTGRTDGRTRDFFGRQSEEALLVKQEKPSSNLTKLGFPFHAHDSTTSFNVMPSCFWATVWLPLTSSAAAGGAAELETTNLSGRGRHQSQFSLQVLTNKLLPCLFVGRGFPCSFASFCAVGILLLWFRSHPFSSAETPRS